MSGLAQDDCNYQTGGASCLINTLTSSSQPTRAYSTAEQGSDSFIPHLPPCAHRNMHIVCVLYGIREGAPFHRWGEQRCWQRAVKSLFFMWPVVSLWCSHDTVLGGLANATLNIPAGICEVVWLSVSGPSVLWYAAVTLWILLHYLC